MSWKPSDLIRVLLEGLLRPVGRDRFDALIPAPSQQKGYINLQLTLVLRFLEDNGADDKMLDTINFCICDNQSWMHEELLALESDSPLVS